jgi:UDPglucose 6-dehydrogenase
MSVSFLPATKRKCVNEMGTKITVVGTGYVGLTSGACLTRLGHDVVCADVDARKVASLQRGVIPIVEDGLEEVVRDGIESRRLRFVLGARQAVTEAKFVFMCLPTPQSEDGSANLSYLLGAAEEIGPYLLPGTIVINKSTVPVGSAERVAHALGRHDVSVASNPEFLREGSAVYDFLNPDRIVIGADTEEIAARVAAVYEGVDTTFVLTGTREAELAKYAANAYLAMRLSYVNNMANLAERLGADGHQVLRVMGLDPRIGPHFLQPGPGWGGSCFPKDNESVASIASSVGLDFPLLREAVRTNETQHDLMVDKVKQLLGKIAGKRIAAWGLAFKAGTDDTRESPAIKVLARLSQLGAEIHAYDPEARHVPSFVHQHADALSACDGADVLVVLTEWAQFAEQPLPQVARRLAGKRVLDTRNLLDREELKTLGFQFLSVGYGNNTRILA